MGTTLLTGVQVGPDAMFNITFGKNTLHEISSSHHDIWNTNKLNYSDKFEPVKWLDNDDKVLVGRRYKPRQINIMQFSEQQWNQKGKNDMNPVELRLGYMKSKPIGRNDNYGYQRDLTKRNLDNKNQNSIFNSRPKTSFLNSFEKTKNSEKPSVFDWPKPKNVVDSPFKSTTSPFQFDKPKSSPFKFKAPKIDPPKSSPFKIFETAVKPDVSNAFEKPKSVVDYPFKFEKSTTSSFKFEPFKFGPSTPFKFTDSQSDPKPTAIQGCFLGLKNSKLNQNTQISTQDQNKKTIDSQNKILKVPIKKTIDHPTDSILLEYCKKQITNEIEFNNSIQYDLQNNPYPNESFSEVKEATQCRKPRDSVGSIDRSLSSVTKKFLFSPVAAKSKLKKPKTQNSKAKTSKTQMKPAVQKICIQNIKIKVVNSN